MVNLFKNCFTVPPSDSEPDLENLEQIHQDNSPLIDFTLLGEVHPRHQKAAEALRFQTMLDPSISAHQIMKAVGRCKDVPKGLKRAICQFISMRVNHFPNYPVNSHYIFSELSNQFSFPINPDLPFNNNIRQYSEAALVATSQIRNTLLNDNLQKNVYNTVLKWQHNGFLHSIPWQTLKPKLELFLREQFGRGVEDPHTLAEIKALVNKEVEAAPGYQEGRFKAYKKEALARLPATQVMATNGEVFQLIKTLDEASRRQLAHSIGVDDIEKNIGDGKYSTVQLAIKMHEWTVAAVKYYRDFPDAERIMALEIASFQQIQKCEHLISLLGCATVVVDEETQKKQRMLMMDFGGVIDCQQLYAILKESYAKDSHETNTLMASVILQMTMAVMELHQQGLCHHDVKPENFTLLLGRIFMIDYGMVSRPKPDTDCGTLTYIPPEFNTPRYDSVKHDAFSLGVALYNVMTSVEEELEEHEEATLVINGEEVVLPFVSCGDPDETVRCRGLDMDPGSIKGETLDEVIALLLIRDPRLRWSPEQVLQLPYFTKMSGKSENTTPQVSFEAL